MAITFRPERVREIREAIGLTQGEFAKRLGVSRQMLNQYEQGHYVPGTEVLMRLLSVTGAKLDSFFTDSERTDESVGKATA